MNDLNLEEEWANKIRDFIQGRFDKKHEDLLTAKKKKPDNDIEQAMLIQLIYALERNGVNKSLVEQVLVGEIKDKKNIAPLAFKLDQYKKLLELGSDFSDVKEVHARYKEKISKLAFAHSPAAWLDEFTPKASGVEFSTNVPKLTHPSVRSVPSFLARDIKTKADAVCTSSLKHVDIDSAISNAANFPVISLLNLKIEEDELKDFVNKGDVSPFIKLQTMKGQADKWLENLKQVFSSQSTSSHYLLKQVYFPLDTEVDGKYHLLCNVNSSSLEHFLYNKVNASIDSKEDVFQIYRVIYPNVIKIFVTSTIKSHSNVSQLNKLRKGEKKLFSCAPPSWKTQTKPPINQKSWFYNGIPNSAIKTDIDYLRDFLLRNEQLSLSTRNPQKRKWLIKWGRNLTDVILFHAQKIQLLPAGWSKIEGIRLKLSQQYFLDPYRDDEAFQAARKTTNWQADVSRDFAKWLNGNLIGKDKRFTPQPEHSKLWMLLMSNALRELSAVPENFKNKETAE